MPLPDNRIRLPSNKIDFATEVGIASQDHDSYPPPQGQARYDHLRMFLIGLLSLQSSFSEPSEFRDGTPWFDLNTQSLKINVNGEWVNFTDAIHLETGTSLTDWYQSVNIAISSLTPECSFGGSVTALTSSIPIPASIQNKLSSDTRAFITINGTSIDPREVNLAGIPYPTVINLNNWELESGDNYFVTLRRIPSSCFVTQNISTP